MIYVQPDTRRARLLTPPATMPMRIAIDELVPLLRSMGLLVDPNRRNLKQGQEVDHADSNE